MARRKRKNLGHEVGEKQEVVEKQTLETKKAPRKFPLAFKLILPLFGILALVLIEVALRVAGFGARVSLFVRDKGADGTPIYRLNPRAGERFFFRRSEGRPVAPSRVLPVEFPVRKPPDTLRIFTLGESTTAGFPYPRSAAFGGYLREMLSDLHPDKKFEVINCGMTALNSYAVLDFMPEVLRCKPDLIVVYCAHNEFYGAHGVGSLEAITANRTLIRLFIALQKTCIFQGVESLVEKFRRAPDAKAATTLIEVMARDQEIRRHSRKHAIAERSFRKNLEAIVGRAQHAGVPILVTTAVSNEKDLSPLRSAHREDLSPSNLERWKELYANAIEAQEAGHPDQAETLYRQALEIDPEFAEVWFRLGQCQAQAERWAEAHESFSSALEFDVLHFRACPVFNEIIRDVVARYASAKVPVILTDLERPFAAQSTGGIPGYELMTDHLHPNTRGTFLIALAISSALSKSAIADHFGPSWDLTRLRKFKEYETAVGYSPIERYLVADILANLYSHFPFDTQLDHQAHLTQLRDEATSCLAALTPEERQQLMQWSGTRHTFPLHMVLGDTYLRQNNYTRAAESYREALRQVGQGRAQDYQLAWIGLGTTERKLGHFDEALRAYDEALKTPGQESTIWYNIGRLQLDRHNVALAQRAFARVLELKPEDPDALISLGLLARDRGEKDAARSYFERAAKTEGGQVAASYQLAVLSLAQQKPDEALVYLKQALAADPKHVQALRLLGYYHLQRSDYAEAEKAFAQAVELDPSDAITWYNRAVAAMSLSGADEAIEFLTRAVELGGPAIAKDAADELMFTPLRKDPRFQALVSKQK